MRIAIVALALVGIGLGVWLASDDDGDGGAEEAVSAAAKIVSPTELSSIAASSPTPIYWAGERPDTELELTEEEGNFYLRYLEDGAEPGSDPGGFLTIGSYPLENPRAELDEVAARPTAVVRHAADGRQVVSSEENPNSVYFVSPDNSAQVEIFDPSADVAMDLALSGDIQPAD
ncbi:MAG TPA: hypothetical protein VIE64_02535 [Solirubrobacterales bacterium]